MPEIAIDEITSPDAWRATFAEFIATLLFVFLGAGSVVVTGALTGGELTTERLLAIALAHGFAIVLLAYATANISGGHINPAVTFAALLTRNITTTRAAMFVLGQLAGAAAGAALLLAYGLGLPLAKRFAMLLGGEIVIESRLGQGTEITLRLPRNGHDQPATSKRAAA